MTESDATPLGLSDLTDDECFVISVFRRWQRICPRCEIAQGHLQEALRKDRLYPALGPLFELFRSLPSQIPTGQAAGSALLSAVEETLLDEIGARSQQRNPSVIEFQKVLDGTNGTVRSVSQIPRSGYDYLFERINRKTTDVYQMLYPL